MCLHCLKMIEHGTVSWKTASDIFLWPINRNQGVCERPMLPSLWFTVRSVGLQFGVHVMTVKSYVTVDLLQSLCACRCIYL